MHYYNMHILVCKFFGVWIFLHSTYLDYVFTTVCSQTSKLGGGKLNHFTHRPAMASPIIMCEVSYRNASWQQQIKFCCKLASNCIVFLACLPCPSCCLLCSGQRTRADNLRGWKNMAYVRVLVCVFLCACACAEVKNSRLDNRSISCSNHFVSIDRSSGGIQIRRMKFVIMISKSEDYHFLPRALNELIGLTFRPIFGYDGPTRRKREEEWCCAEGRKVWQNASELRASV